MNETITLERHLTGAYRFHLGDGAPDAPDHLVVYLHGSGGDPDLEYLAQTTVCGRDLGWAGPPRRQGPACPACLDGAGQAVEAAREELAELVPSRLEA